MRLKAIQHIVLLVGSHHNILWYGEIAFYIRAAADGLRKIAIGLLFVFDNRKIWKMFFNFPIKAVYDFGKRASGIPAPIKLYGMIKQVKFNIIQIPDKGVVGGYKTPFLFEGATCQKLTKKKEGCGMEQCVAKKETATFRGRGVDKNNIAIS